MRDHYNIQLAALEGFDLAVARLDRKLRFTFLNPAARRLFAIGPEQELELRALFSTEKAYQQVEEELQRRWQGKSSAYDTAFRPLNAHPSSAEIPVSVYAFPDVDANGDIVGSLVIVRDLREDGIRSAIYRAMESANENVQFLSEVAQQLRRLVPYDEFRIVAFNQGGTHVRRLYSTDLDARKKYPHRWWAMPPFMQTTLARRVCGVIEIDELRSDPDYARHAQSDRSLRLYFASPVRQAVNIPIRQGGSIVAFFSLDSNTDGLYSQETVDLLERLPMQEVVHVAMHREEQRQQRSMLDLIRKVGAKTNDVKHIAEALVNGLCTSFGWNHVSIFQRDPGVDRLKLLCQANENHASLPATFSLPCAAPSDGQSDNYPGCPLVEALQTQQIAERLASLDDSPFHAPGQPSPQGSALAVPISGRKADWILYVETNDLNAFAREEKEMLELLAAEAGVVLHRSALFALQVAVLGAINDAVIETNDDGSISWCNKAASYMLGLPHKPDGRIAIDDLIVGQKDGLPLPTTPDFYHEEVVLRAWGGDGRTFPGMLSSSALPPHLGGKVYVASDFTFQQQVQRFEHFETVFQQAALEGRTPLALAAAWLDQFADQGPVDRASIDKILRQLARADLPLERLIRLNAAQSGTGQRHAHSDLCLALADTLQGLPDSMQERIDCLQADDALPVGLPFNDVQFCVECIIAFAMRTRPQSKYLRIRTTRSGVNAVLMVTGDWAPDIDDAHGSPAARWKRKTLCDLALGESVIQKLVQQAKGSYQRDFSPGFSIRIVLPLHT